MGPGLRGGRAVDVEIDFLKSVMFADGDASLGFSSPTPSPVTFLGRGARGLGTRAGVAVLDVTEGPGDLIVLGIPGRGWMLGIDCFCISWGLPPGLPIIFGGSPGGGACTSRSPAEGVIGPELAALWLARNGGLPVDGVVSLSLLGVTRDSTRDGIGESRPGFRFPRSWEL
jgi:hypothetical protein